MSLVKEDIEYYSCVFYISSINFAIKPISYVLLNGTVEECRLLTHYTDLQIQEKTALNFKLSKSQKKLDVGEFDFFVVIMGISYQTSS